MLGKDGEPAVAAMREIVDGCKGLSFRLATRRAFDPQPRIEALAATWDEGFAKLDNALQ